MKDRGREWRGKTNEDELGRKEMDGGTSRGKKNGLRREKINQDEWDEETQRKETRNEWKKKPWKEKFKMARKITKKKK